MEHFLGRLWEQQRETESDRKVDCKKERGSGMGYERDRRRETEIWRLFERGTAIGR